MWDGMHHKQFYTNMNIKKNATITYEMIKHTIDEAKNEI